MEQKRENIEQIDKKKIDSNLIDDNQKTSERNIQTGLIDNDVNPQKNKNLQKYDYNIAVQNIMNKIIEEKRINKAEQKNLEVKIKLNEKENIINNINNIVTDLNISNVNNNSGDENESCAIFLSLCCGKIISLLIYFSFASIFIYYKNHCKQCKSTLYTKINKVLLKNWGH